MVVFVKDKGVESTEPTVQVDNPFAPGTYTFSLVVTDTAKNESAPAMLKVTVRRAAEPPVTTVTATTTVTTVLGTASVTTTVTPVRPFTPTIRGGIG